MGRCSPGARVFECWSHMTAHHYFDWPHVSVYMYRARAWRAKCKILIFRFKPKQFGISLKQNKDSIVRSRNLRCNMQGLLLNCKSLFSISQSPTILFHAFCIHQIKVACFGSFWHFQAILVCSSSARVLRNYF